MRKFSHVFHYLGIAAAVAVPAYVVAQTLPVRNRLAPGQVLFASDILQLRDAIAALQADTSVRLIKGDNVYQDSADSPLAAQNAIVTAEKGCRNANDVLLSCGCSGKSIPAGTNSPQFELRTVSGKNGVGGLSSCACQGVNIGDSTTSRVLVATVSCLSVP